MQEQVEKFQLLETELRAEIAGADGRENKQIEDLKIQIQAALDKRLKTKAKKARILEDLESLRNQRDFEISEFTKALNDQKLVAQQLKDQLAQKDKEVKKKDKEMMSLRGKVLESREEYFSNLQRLDATLSKKTESGSKKKEEEENIEDIVRTLQLKLRKKSCDDTREKPVTARALAGSPKKPILAAGGVKAVDTCDQEIQTNDLEHHEDMFQGHQEYY